MANPLMGMIGNSMPTNNRMAMLQKFQQFRSQFPTNANPQQILNSLVSTGRFTNEQVEQAKQMVNQIKNTK
jgi:hypothetical protein